MEEEKIKNNKKLLIIGILCLIAIISIVGFTYSFFAVNVQNNTSITGTAASLSLTVTAEKVSPASSVTGGLIPQLDAYITSAVIGVNGSCVDGNNNLVCQVYKITVKNNGGSTIKVNGIVELDNKDNPHLKWARILGVDTTSPTIVGTIKTPQEKELVSEETFTGTQQKDYYIVTWISETGLGQTDTGVFNGVVTFSDVNSDTGTDNPALVTLTNLGLEDDLNEEVLTTFTTTSKLDGTTGIYAAEDDIGTSYYFRGNVTNNYVKFGKYTEDAYQVITEDSTTGEYIYSYASTCPTTYYECTQIASANDDMYWRIVRINGDGTVRLIYDGTQAYENGEEEKLNYIGMQPYNMNYNDNAYVGYMYGTPGSATYADTHANINDSDLKKTTDAWYLKYLNTNYSSSIADAIYCNDRKPVTDTTINNFFGATGEGFGTNATFYSLYGRMTLTDEGMPSSFTPTLKCEQENDRFTKNNTVSGVVGNGNLEYPIAAITADEMTFAGSYLYEENDESYLFETNEYWTMSPGGFDVGFAVAFVGYDRAININLVYNNIVARPSISLSSTDLKYGTGVIGDEFRISA